MGMVIQKEDIWIFLLDDGHGGYTSEDKVVSISIWSQVFMWENESLRFKFLADYPSYSDFSLLSFLML